MLQTYGCRVGGLSSSGRTSKKFRTSWLCEIFEGRLSRAWKYSARVPCLVSVAFWVSSHFGATKGHVGVFSVKLKKNSVIFFVQPCKRYNFSFSFWLLYALNKQTGVRAVGKLHKFQFQDVYNLKAMLTKKILAEMKANNSAHVCKIHKMHMD